MTVVTESETSAACLAGTLGDVHNRTGAVARNAAAGAFQLIADASARRWAFLVVPPEYMDDVLRQYGIDPDSLPRPGEASDIL